MLDLILKRSDDVGKFVGDLSGVATLEGATEHAFKITLGQLPEDAGLGRNIIVVFMQMWGDLGSPPHLVIVGRSLIDLDAHFERRRKAEGFESKDAP